MYKLLAFIVGVVILFTGYCAGREFDGKDDTASNNLLLVGIVFALVLSLAGCISSPIAHYTTGIPKGDTTNAANVTLYDKGASPYPYRKLKKLHVSAKEVFILSTRPTKDDAQTAMRQAAAAIGADAVIDVHYSTGIGIGTWGYYDAGGMAVRYE